MKSKSTVVALIGLFSLVSGSRPDDKTDQLDDTLERSLKEADAIFTGKIDKITQLAQTNTVPPNTFGEITFKDTKALRGAIPEAKLTYSFRQGKKNYDLDAKGEVVVALQKTGVMVIVPSTGENLALARKFADKSLSE